MLNRSLLKKHSRCLFLHLIAATVIATPDISRSVAAHDYPTRPARIIVGFAPGGGNDIAARQIGQWLTDRFGQSFVIENRPGAGGNIATEAVVRAPADGYTLLLASLANAANATLYRKLNFNFIQDIAPVAGLVRVPNVMVVNPNLPTSSVSEFVDYARANPGKVNMGSGGTGGPVHVIGALFNVMAGLDMQHVPYRGEALALMDLIAGRTQIVFGSMPASVQYIRAGKLRGLAVTTETRAATLPELATIGEFVPGYEASTWYGIGVPKDTPDEIIQRLNEAINAGLTDRALRARLAELGGSPIEGPPNVLRKLVADETQRWAKVIRASNMEPE